MKTSDHDYLEAEITMDNSPYVTQPKEFYYSNLINQPKMEDLQNYLEYILKYLDLVVNNQLTKESFDKIKRTFTDRTTIVMRNKPEAVYDIEKKFMEMMEK